MTRDQQEFLRSLSPAEQQQFSQMSNEQRNSAFGSYMKAKGGGNNAVASRSMTAPKSATNNLLSLAISNFGDDGMKYVQNNFDMFDDNLSSSGGTAGMKALSAYARTGNAGTAAAAGAMSFGKDYIKDTAGEAAGDFAKNAAVEAYNQSIADGMSPADAKIAADSAGRNWDIGLNAGVSGALSGATTYLTTGDAGEAAEAGAVSAGKETLVGYSSKYIAERAYNAALSQAAIDGLSDAAAKEAATQAGASAAASYAPVVGGVVSLGASAMQGDVGAEQVADAAVAAFSAATTPYVGWAYGAVKMASAVTKNVKQNKSRNQRIFVEFDADTGKSNISFGGKMSPDDFYKLRPEAVAKIEAIVSKKSQEEQRLREEYIMSLPVDQQDDARLRLQGSSASLSLSERDIQTFNSDEWLGSDNIDEYITGKHSGMWESENVATLEDMRKKDRKRSYQFDQAQEAGIDKSLAGGIVSGDMTSAILAQSGMTKKPSGNAERMPQYQGSSEEAGSNVSMINSLLKNTGKTKPKENLLPQIASYGEK